METNTNALNISTSHGVIASPKGAAISFFMGLLRRSAPRNDQLLIAFVLVYCLRKDFTHSVIPDLIKPAPYLIRGGDGDPHHHCKEVLETLH